MGATFVADGCGLSAVFRARLGEGAFGGEGGEEGVGFDLLRIGDRFSVGAGGDGVAAFEDFLRAEGSEALGLPGEPGFNLGKVLPEGEAEFLSEDGEGSAPRARTISGWTCCQAR